MSQTEPSMHEHTLDRRGRRTRRQLKEALFALILEKGYDAVTIEDITGRADLGRTTFYLHYRDKEELLLEAIDSIANDLIARLPPPLRSGLKAIKLRSVMARAVRSAKSGVFPTAFARASP